MKRQIQLWGTRTLALAVLVVATQKWGMPLYKQYFTPKKAAVYIPTAKVRKGEFVVSFHEIGTLEAERSVAVNTEVGGKIISLVDDGRVVQAGDGLVELDTTDLEREVRNQELTYGNAEAAVDRANAELDILKESNKTEVLQAEKQLEYDKTERDRAKEQLAKKKRLADEKLIPGDQVDQAELQLDAKKLAVEKGELDLELKKKEVQSKEAQKKAEVAKVKFAAEIQESNLEEIRSSLQGARIAAPASGLVVIAKDWTPDGRRKLQEGDSVRPRQMICMLPDLTTMLVKVQVGESDAPRIRVGVRTLIRLEAVPDKVFHGTVEDISSLATEGRWYESGTTPGRKNFEVTIKIKESDPKTLKPGMTADVEFICDMVANAVFVPLESVIERDGKTYVFVKEGGRYNRTVVEVGKPNDSFVCIKRGLRKGQLVALRDPTRPLEEQEAGAATPGEDEKEEKKRPVPIPGAEAQ